MLTVGCSEGQDATAWHTQIIKPRIQNFLSGRPAYEAIECWKAPKQGRSGGGLFTDNGYIAGVCDFAEPQGDHGLYATPRSIYHLLDRNKLMALYSPPTRGSGTLVADNRSSTRSQSASVLPIARSQSPDHDEPVRGRGADARNDDTLPPPPPPTFLGIVIPDVPGERGTRAASAITRQTNWHPIHVPETTSEADSPHEKVSAETDKNHDVPPSDEPDLEKSDADGEDLASRPVAESSTGSSSKSRWRAVKTAPATPVENNQN